MTKMQIGDDLHAHDSYGFIPLWANPIITQNCLVCETYQQESQKGKTTNDEDSGNQLAGYRWFTLTGATAKKGFGSICQAHNEEVEKALTLARQKAQTGK